MSDPVAIALIAAITSLGTALLGAWGRRMASEGHEHQDVIWPRRRADDDKIE